MDAEGSSPGTAPQAPKNAEEEITLLEEEAGASHAELSIFEEPAASPPPTAGNGGKPPRKPPLIALGGDDNDESGEQPAHNPSDDTAAFDKTVAAGDTGAFNDSGIFGKDAAGDAAPSFEEFSTAGMSAAEEPAPTFVGTATADYPRSRFEPVAVACSVLSIGCLSVTLFFLIQSMTGGAL